MNKSHCFADTVAHDKTKRDRVAFCSTRFHLGCVSSWSSFRFFLCCWWSFQLQLAAHALAVLARARSDHPRSVVGALRHTQTLQLVQSRHTAFCFFIVPLLITRPKPVSAVVLARGAARVSTRAHRRTCAGPVTRKTFDREAVSKLECFCLLF